MNKVAAFPSGTVNENLTRALAFARRGWRVFPCEVRGKRPFGRFAPHGLLDATDDADLIARWWAEEPEANIGIATGAASGFFVADIDPLHGGDLSWLTLTANVDEPQTATVRTPSGGQHLYFEMPADMDIRNSVGKLGPGLDVRGTGGYVLAAGSETDAGCYRWDGSSVIAAAPDWLLDLMAAPVHSSTPRARSSTTVKSVDAFITDGRIPEGQRHDALLRILGAARRQGASEGALCALLDTENQRCDPPYPPRECYALVRSVLKYAPDPDIDTAKVFASVRVPAATSVDGPVSGRLQVPEEWCLLDDVQLVELADPEFSIEGIVPRRAVGAIYGPPGSTKTTLAAALAGSLATGRAFFGHEVRHRGATVYVATEDVSGFKVRLMAWKRVHQLALDEVLGVYTFPEPIDLLDALCVARFTRFLQDATFMLPLELLVIDTYAGVTPGANENAAEVMTVAMEHARRWRTLLSCTVLVVHHSNATGTRERGHSAMRGAADLMISMTPVDDVIHVACSKLRNGAPFPTLTLKLVDVGGGCVLRLAADVQPTSTLTVSQRKALDILRDTFPEDGASASLWQRACAGDMSEATFYRAVKTLSEVGLVALVGSHYRTVGGHA
jgi:hypothetical protein